MRRTASGCIPQYLFLHLQGLVPMLLFLAFLV
jgi:hypothetical protein